MLRWVVALLGAIVLAGASPVWAQAQVEPSAETLVVQGRDVRVVIWPAQGEPQAVIVFSHGMGGAPRAYDRLIQTWAAAGFTVLAPLHVDSQVHPDRASYNGPSGFFARIADMAAVRNMARERAPGLPLIAAGHSYGALMSAMAGGAVTAAGPQADPDVDAVIMLSSPGTVPGLMPPDTYASLATPTLTVTGDADLVPGYADDWRAHRSAFDGAAGTGHMMLIFEGGGHGLVRDADAEDFDALSQATIDFIRARAMGDAEAAQRLQTTSAAGVIVERK